MNGKMLYLLVFQMWYGAIAQCLGTRMAQCRISIQCCTTSSSTCGRHGSYANRVSEGYLEIREVVTKEVVVIEVLSQ